MTGALLALALAASPALAQEAWEAPDAEEEEGGHRLSIAAWGGDALDEGGSGRSYGVLGGEVAWAFDQLDVGLAVAIPEGYYGRVAPRSGLATSKGLDVLAGVIDSDYRGEVRCLLYNAGEESINLPAQSKICQLIIEKIITPSAHWADEISDTDRGSGGFGSTD